jgi:hypothetical protein
MAAQKIWREKALACAPKSADRRDLAILKRMPDNKLSLSAKYMINDDFAPVGGATVNMPD